MKMRSIYINGRQIFRTKARKWADLVNYWIYNFNFGFSRHAIFYVQWSFRDNYFKVYKSGLIRLRYIKKDLWKILMPQ